MSGKMTLKQLTVEQAYEELEAACYWMIKNAQWYSPYNGYPFRGRIMKHAVHELRRPLLTLKLAKLNQLKEQHP